MDSLEWVRELDVNKISTYQSNIIHISLGVVPCTHWGYFQINKHTNINFWPNPYMLTANFVHKMMINWGFVQPDLA